MIPLFLGLTLANLVGLLTALGLGYARLGGLVSPERHTLVGVLAAILCCAVHCVVFTYFIATAKWVQHAVLLRRLDPKLVLSTRSFKAQAFPAALASMAAVFVTAVLGAAAENYAIAPAWHHLAALGMIGVNLLAAGFEYAAIRRNGLLIDHILELVGAGGAESHGDGGSQSAAVPKSGPA